MGTGGRRRRGRTAAVVVAVAVAGAAVAAANGVGVAKIFGAGPDAGDSPDLPPATAVITRETLVDTTSESGDLGFGEATTVHGRLSGTVTGLPGPGSTIARGKTLYRVDNRPVVLLYGKLPAYRTLSPGTSGADVEQFEQNLKTLGYDGFTVDDDYTSSTATAVREWQDDLGLAETGTVDFGRVYYATGAVRVDTRKSALGDATGPGRAVLTTTGSARVVTVELPYTERRLVRKGGAVSVTLPSDKAVPGEITGSIMVIKPAASAQEQDTTVFEVSVTVTDPKNLAGLQEASLDVAFRANERRNVLTVPVAALLALAGGGYGVQLVEGDSTRIVPARTGLFAGGRVEVTGAGLAENLKVGVPA
jgi:multidrug efflux system membrane fusion protein